jgi:hypothetical protein
MARCLPERVHAGDRTKHFEDISPRNVQNVAGGEECYRPCSSTALAGPGEPLSEATGVARFREGPRGKNFQIAFKSH